MFRHVDVGVSHSDVTLAHNDVMLGQNDVRLVHSDVTLGPNEAMSDADVVPFGTAGVVVVVAITFQPRSGYLRG